jgi:hypothetical protein
MLAGVAVLFTAFLSVNTGLVLLDAPITLRSPFSSRSEAASLPPNGTPESATPSDGSPQRLLVDVGDSSYTPSSLMARAGSPVQLVLRTDNTVGCTRSIVVPQLNLEESLPETGETVLDLGTLKPGNLRFTCGMGMYSGSIQVS